MERRAEDGTAGDVGICNGERSSTHVTGPPSVERQMTPTADRQGKARTNPGIASLRERVPEAASAARG